jgi:NADH-quinone oxidoreductase subunit L
MLLLSVLWLVPALPFAGFLILALLGHRLTHKAVAVIGAGSVSLSALVAILIVANYAFVAPSGGAAYSQVLWQWMRIGGFAPSMTLYLDGLSLIMMVMVAFVGAMIHIYSTAFMAGDEGYSRYFAYLNLFVGSMLVLVLADNLLFLYLGWEGVGLCSYLLIGFWYRDRNNARAALKAFFMTRIGDTGFVIGIFLLFVSLGTLQIQPLMESIARYPVGAPLCNAAAGLLLAGALGKSAQLPLQTWLPDAMAGPTPVSALIHAATMVTAGVYLIARTHVLFEMAPVVLFCVAMIGVVTQFLASCSALTQFDIKRVLAYSTISQIGYMFLALGVGAWPAAIYHFVTHGFFKSALFLGAGVLIKTLDGEHDIFKMGGLRRHYPVAFRAFLMAALTLAAVPPLTLTFNSKDLILNQVWLSPYGGPALWAVGLAGAFLTAAYAFRLVFVVFYGPEHDQPVAKPPWTMLIPFAVLALLGGLAGFPDLLDATAGIRSFYTFLHAAMVAPMWEFSFPGGKGYFQAIYAVTSFAGIVVAYLLYVRRPRYARALVATAPGRLAHQGLLAGWGFDWVYSRVFVRPYMALAQFNRRDFVNAVYGGLALFSRGLHAYLSATVTGNVRWYMAAIAIGAIIILALVLGL